MKIKYETHEGDTHPVYLSDILGDDDNDEDLLSQLFGINPEISGAEGELKMTNLMKARIIEKESLEQMYNIREKFYTYPSTKGKMHWENISVETIIENLDSDGVMVFTKKFGEVSGKDLDKFKEGN